MWFINKGEREFTGGRENWQLAAAAARQCGKFSPDDEDEQVTDDPVSCYNCRFRRWSVASFTCRMPPGGPDSKPEAGDDLGKL